MVKSNNPGGATPPRPHPAGFDDYRAYLAQMVHYLKQTRRRFSHRYFAEKAGYKSSAFLKLVMDGKRNLSPASVQRFADALELTAPEREDFEALVLFNQAKTDAERNRYFKRLARHGDVASAARLQKDQYALYSLWYAPIIHEMVSLPDFVDDPIWISERLWPKVSATKVKQAVELLLRLGLLHRDAQGVLRAEHPNLETSPHAPLAVRNYHRALLAHAAKALENIPTPMRNITSVTLRLSRQQYESVCERIEAFRLEILSNFDNPPQDQNTTPADDEEVYALGFTVAPCSLDQNSKKEKP